MRQELSANKHIQTQIIFAQCDAPDLRHFSHLFSRNAMLVPSFFRPGSSALLRWLLGTSCVLAGSSAGHAQLIFEGSQEFEVEIGVEVVSSGARFSNLQVSFVIPREWPEQDVEHLRTEASPSFKRIKAIDRKPGARQVTATLTRLSPDKPAKLVYHMRVIRRAQTVPDNTSQLKFVRRPPKDALGPSPMIETKDRRVIQAAKQGLASKTDSAWEQVRQLNEATRRDVKFSGVAPLKGALAAILDGHGDCEERSSVFVAYCRIHGIPARTVLIPNHAYAEFLLEDPEKGPTWYPVESVRDEFGRSPANFVILQKGDNYRLPGFPTAQRYITETVRGSGPPGAAPPQVRSIVNIRPISRDLTTLP